MAYFKRPAPSSDETSASELDTPTRPIVRGELGGLSDPHSSDDACGHPATLCWADEMERVDPSVPPLSRTVPATPPREVFWNQDIQIHANENDLLDQSDSIPEQSSIVRPTRYMSADTEQRVAQLIGAERNRTCLLCGFSFHQRKRLRTHIASHYTGIFCSCGFSSNLKETVRKHQAYKSDTCAGAAIFQVDESGLATFINEQQPILLPTRVPVRPLLTSPPSLLATRRPRTSTPTDDEPAPQRRRLTQESTLQPGH